MTPPLRPAGITANRSAGVLEIKWTDGHLSAYPFGGLREACPCAECRGGHANMGAPADPNVFTLTPARTYTLANLELVGNYGLQPEWDDGHRTGIYPWKYLRDLCPCAECRARRAAPEGAVRG